MLDLKLNIVSLKQNATTDQIDAFIHAEFTMLRTGQTDCWENS